LTGNTQSSYYFLILHSRKRIVCNNWTALPIPAEVIGTVHQLANACKKYKGIVFTDKEGNISLTNDARTEMGNCTNVQPHATNVVNITGVDKDDATAYADDVTPLVTETENVTGVHDDTTGVHNVTGVHDDTTGVHNDTTGVHNDV